MLSNESIQKLNEGYAARMKAASTSLPVTQTPTTQPSIMAPSTEKTLQGNRTSETPVRMYGDISPEEQVQKFGGLVGSPEYYAAKAKESAVTSVTKRVGPVVGATVAGFAAGGPFGALAGAGLGAGVMADLYPNQETWDRMATTDKITHVIDKTVEGGIKLAFALPMAFAKAIPNLASYVARPVLEKVNPLTLSGAEELAKREQEKPYTLNVGGREVTTLDPIYTNVVDNFKAAKTAGFGDTTATVYGYFQGGVQVFNEALVGSLFAKGLKTMAKPPKRITPGETVANTVPVTAVFKSAEESLKKEAGIRTKDGPAAMYSSVPVEFGNEVAKQTGKNGRVFYKITPAGQGSVEVALVQNVGGLVDTLKRRIGLGDEAIVGAAGPEIKIESHIVKVGEQNVPQKMTPSTIQEGDVFYHGTRTENFREGDTTGSLFLTKQKSMAESYAHGGGGGREGGKITSINVEGDVLPWDEGLKGFVKSDGGLISKNEAQNMFQRYEASPVFDTATVKEVALNPNKKTLDLTFKGYDVGNGYVKKSDPETGLFIETLTDLKNRKVGSSEQQRAISVLLEQTKRYGFDWGRTTREFSDRTFADVIAPALEQKGYGSIRFGDDADITTMAFPKSYKILKPGERSVSFEESTQSSKGGGRVVPITEPYKGSENRPITRVQVDNVSNIGKMNEIDPAVMDIVVKTMTGKSVIGELTNAEYVRVAKTLSGMNKLGEYAPGGKASLWTTHVGQYISPARSWMEAVQRKTHVPIWDTFLDIENGFKLAKTTQEAYMNEGRTIFGKYADDGLTEQRRLVDAHMHGDKNAIVNNASLSPEVKTELLKVVDDVSQFFEKHGVDLGVEKTAYRKNDAGYYLPDVVDLGGILQMYKSEAKGGLPDGRDFFAKQKKKGGGYVRIDDPLKLIDIYARDGAKAKFISEPLARASELEKTKIPEVFRNSFRSAVLEKTGYAGGFEKFLDEVSSRMNQKMNRNVPPDLGRKINQGIFTYAYVNALSSPGTWIRNELTNNVMLYSRLGPEFWPQAKAKALTSEGLAEVRKAGFLNEHSQPFGEDVGSVGGKVKKVAEFALTPQGLSDSTGRATAYFQVQFKMKEALDKYNAGKITWPQAEKAMGMDGMSPIEAQRVRQNIQAGNVEGAFTELARSVIDETNFPYRRGSSSRITFGETGKIATFLYKWQIEYSHTMGRWLRTGQTDKFVRYYTASVAAVNSLKEAYGLDFTSTLFLGPVNAKYPPSVQIGLDMINVLQAQTDDNAQAIDDAKESLVNHLKNFGMPGGVDTKNWQTFWRSYEKGPDRNGLYGIYGPKGDMTEDPAPFHEIWQRLFGLPTVTKVQTATALKEAANRTTEISGARRKVAELRNAGKDDEADALVLEWEARGEDIEPGNQSYDRFEIPRTERVFEKLTPGSQEALESKFYPKK